MRVRLTLLLVLGISPAALAQDTPDLLGTWTFTVKGHEADARCGSVVHEGVLDVERKITPRAYRGKVRTEESSEKCRGSQLNNSGATIRVKDQVVEIEYDEDGWEQDRLLYDGDTMEGSRGGGIVTYWNRQSDDESNAPTAEQLADLERFLEQVEPDVNASLSQEYQERLEKGLAKTGLTEDEVSQVAEQTIARMTSCMLDELRTSVAAQEIPIEQVLDQQNVTVVFNPNSIDVQNNECVQDASWNAGVVIR